jgi:hypothetical protein
MSCMIQRITIIFHPKLKKYKVSIPAKSGYCKLLSISLIWKIIFTYKRNILLTLFATNAQSSSSESLYISAEINPNQFKYIKGYYKPLWKQRYAPRTKQQMQYHQGKGSCTYHECSALKPICEQKKKKNTLLHNGITWSYIGKRNF